LKRTLFVAALAGGALVSLPFEARAQAPTVHFGVAAGAAIPVSDLSNTHSTGFNGTVTVGLNPTMIPLGIRIDGAYNQFGGKNAIPSVHFTSVTGNLVYKIPQQSFSPYAIGGAGWYNAGSSGGGSSTNNFGWNLGGGISMALSGFDTFLEARYNQVQVTGGSLKFVPITFGVMF
jgi:opacity protein-like surface antigen